MSSTSFQLNENLSIDVLQGDITKIEGYDAIVNAANTSLLGGGGVDGAIHLWAGKGLLAACKEIPEVSPGVRCPTGEARITPAFHLPCDYVIHTVGPIYKNDETSAPELSSATRSALALANQYQLSKIAFPAVSCGAYGYPKYKAASVMINECLQSHGKVRQIAFVLFEKSTLNAWLERCVEFLSV